MELADQAALRTLPLVEQVQRISESVGAITILVDDNGATEINWVSGTENREVVRPTLAAAFGAMRELFIMDDQFYN